MLTLLTCMFEFYSAPLIPEWICDPCDLPDKTGPCLCRSLPSRSVAVDDLTGCRVVSSRAINHLSAARRPDAGMQRRRVAAQTGKAGRPSGPGTPTQSDQRRTSGSPRLRPRPDPPAARPWDRPWNGVGSAARGSDHVRCAPDAEETALRVERQTTDGRCVVRTPRLTIAPDSRGESAPRGEDGGWGGRQERLHLECSDAATI